MTYLNTSKSFESTVNSSTATLNNGSTFTGTAEANAYPDVMVSVKTDQSGVLYMEFSPDGTNWDSSLSFNYDPTKINPPHVLVKGSRHYRTRFTNDSGSNQTYFRLQTDFGAFNKLTSPINGTVSQVYDATVTRPIDYFMSLSEGKFQGYTDGAKFGYNSDVDTAAEELWSYGGMWTPMASAETLDVVSSSANDTNSAGTGARQVLISGIDANREAQEETVNLNGVTTVTTSNTWLGVNRVSVVSAGTTKYNEGNITIDSTTSGDVQAYIPLGDSITQQCIYNVPSTANAYITHIYVNVTKPSGAAAVLSINGYYEYNGVRYNVLVDELDTDSGNTLTQQFPIPIKIPAGSIWYIRVQSDTANTFVRGRVEQILVDI